MSRTPFNRRGRVPRSAALMRVVVLLLIAGSLSLLGVGSSSAAPGVAAADKVRPKLSHQLEEKGEATFWIRFEQARLADAARIEDWDARGKAVYDALRNAAETNQKEVRELLDSEGASYQSFWATNAIRVEAGSEALAADVAADSHVLGLYPTFTYRLEEPTKGKNVHTPDAVEWGVADINADDVWSDYGVTGEGIVVGNIDTGVQFDHPALVNAYRGNNGDGTFTHDYNWFDAAGACPDAPCDNNDHGTHTMGTMAGDDGAGNQIGVAPGAKWIAANGCCPSDAALIASGEWMLAPTDLEGENPDVTKRPNVINNSWGSELPSNDPFMEDVLQAWEASGIFGTWANGNGGPACETSGSPGSRTINYSVGAYDVNDQIAGFSARGVGQDGEIKPNISAPGVNVRSSVPGDGYASFNGTSMAAPHLAGSIALLWSGAPSLVGDIDGTRALLDDTAIDNPDSQCGGSGDDNNVFGEGRLDALALLDAAPVGDSGTLAGTVSDADSGEPIAGATIDIAGDSDRSLTTGDDGSYSVPLAAGDYTVTASMFGYESQSTDATVVTGETTAQDFALAASESVTLSGTVTDGSGHGWPLYARLSFDGPAEDVWTDPETGDYSVSLPSGSTYTMTVEADYTGYETATQEVVLEDSDATQDVELTVDDSCTAPGYSFSTDGVTEDFNDGVLPDGWSIEDNQGNEEVWRFDDPGERGNLTGGDGAFAISDSDFYGSGESQDTSLVTPVIDMSSLATPVVGFKQDYNNLGDVADVDVSVDGGATWETVLNQTTDVRGPREDVVQLPMASGQSEVQVRFHHYEASYDWWWQVDDVFVGNRSCDPIEGGLVVGNVRDQNTRDGINGATVTSLDRPEENTTTKATPEDASLADGFYWMFSSLTGRHQFEASANQYGTQVRRATVDADDATRRNFRLSAGHLSVAPTSLEGTRRLGGQPLFREFTVSNDGSAPVDVELTERKGDFEILGANGKRMSSEAIARMEGAPLQEIKAPVSVAAQVDGKKGPGRLRAAADAPHDAPWTSIAELPSVAMDNRVVHVDGQAYSIAGGDGTTSSAAVNAYDPATLAWTERADLPAARNAVSAGAIGGQIVVTGGWAAAGPSTATWVYDPAGDAWSAAADAPTGLAASGQAVAGGKLYVVGGCTTSACTPMSDAVAAYDPDSDSWTELADYPQAAAFVSCGGIDGKVYCTGGNDGTAGTASSYAYDPGADSWTAVADAPVDTWASGYTVANGVLVVNGGVQGAVITNRTFAYDPGADSWTDLPNSNTARYRGGMACGLYKVGGSSGSFNAEADSATLPGYEDCGSSAGDVEWMSVSPTSVTLEPGDSVTVEVTMDPDVAQPGTYTAAVGIEENAPGSVDPVTVTMEVTPPSRWGKVMGTVTGQACSGDVTALPGATLQVDSWAGSWTFSTESDGSYAHWFNQGANPLQLIAAKDGYQPQTRKVRIRKGKTVVEDFTLKEAGC